MKKNKKKRAQIITIKSSFSGGTLTNYSGIKAFHKFMEKMELRKSLNSFSIKMHHNIQTDTGNLLSILILGILCGMNRISKIETFTLDPLVQKLYGLSKKISDSGIIDRLKRFGMKQSSEYMDIMGETSNKVHNKLRTSSDILDLDSSVKTVYGKQQGAEKGFNGKKKGARSYRPKSWDRARQFSAVRILKSVESNGRLFPVKNWEYFCYCTNIVDSPLEIHRLYGDRGTSENWIENVKNQMFAGQLLTDNFWANEMLWLSSVMAYNISVWMRKLSDDESWHEEPATFRAWFVQLAGKVVNSGRQIYLKMYKAYYYKERWRKIDEAVDNLSFA